MPTFVNTLPQKEREISIITIKEVVDKLPEELPWKINVWIADKLAKYGITTEALIFLVEQEEEPSIDMRMFFEELFKPFPATVYEDFMNRKYSAIRLYNEGKLIINKEDMTYKELPTPIYKAPILTIDKLMIMLPNEIKYTDKIYLTGGMVKNGFSNNDIDLIIFEEEDKGRLLEIALYFEKLTGWKVHCGNSVMKEREPVYCFLLYDGGIWQQ